VSTLAGPAVSVTAALTTKQRESLIQQVSKVVEERIWDPAFPRDRWRAAVNEHPTDPEAALYLAIALNRADDPAAESALKTAQNLLYRFYLETRPADPLPAARVSVFAAAQEA